MWQNPCKTNWKYQPCTDFCSVVVFFIHSFWRVRYNLLLNVSGHFHGKPISGCTVFHALHIFFWKKKHHEKKIPSTRLHSILQKRPLPTNASRKDTDRVFVLILFTYFFLCVFPLYCHGWAKHFSHIVLMSHHKVHAFCATDRTCATRQNYYENIRLPDVYVFQCLLFLQIHHYHRLTLHLFCSHITCTFVFSRLDGLNAFILFQSMASTTEPCILF